MTGPGRPLPGTDLEVGRVVFGTMAFGSRVDESEAAAMVDLCRAAGITMFDTANTYAGGRSEQILGRVVRPFRDQVLIATKCGGQADPPGLSAQAIRHEIDASLHRLGTDYVDLYYLHMPDRSTPIEETLAALAEIVAAGKVRYVGHSNHAAWQVAEMHYLATANGWPVPTVGQPLYNLLARRVETEYAACAQRLGHASIVYNPLAGGMLTGKYRPGPPPTDGSRFTSQLYRSRYWNDDAFAAVDRLTEIARSAGLTLIELAYRWVLGRSLTTAMLLGASSAAQLEANLAALDGPSVDDATLAACDGVWAGLAGAAPGYVR